MTKLLNLDELAAPKRTVRFKGEDHAVEELTVATFIELQSDLEGVDKAMKTNDTRALMAAGKAIISRSVPTMVDQIPQLNAQQMVALVELISNTYPQSESDDPKAEAATAA